MWLIWPMSWSVDAWLVILVEVSVHHSQYPEHNDWPIKANGRTYELPICTFDYGFIKFLISDLFCRDSGEMSTFTILGQWATTFLWTEILFHLVLYYKLSCIWILQFDWLLMKRMEYSLACEWHFHGLLSGRALISLKFSLQASPSDPENFPFVVIGNKVDVDGGNSRVVFFFPLSPL